MTNANATLPYESASDWNRRHPPGTQVRVRLSSGELFEAATASGAQQWGAFAVLTLRERDGLWTTIALEPCSPARAP